MKTVLIIDADLGFIFWLGKTLDDGGYRAIPAKSIPDAISLLDQVKLEIDVLIVNPALQGSARFNERLRQANSNVKVLALVSDAEPPAAMRIDASHRRPTSIDESTRLEWLNLVEGVLFLAANDRAMESRRSV